MSRKELLTIDEFIACVNDKSIMDGDGSGYYATETETSRKLAIPSEIKAGVIDRSFTHIEWFNK